MRDALLTTTLDRYRSSLSHVKPLDPAQELELARRWREHGDEAAGRKLVESSLPFVIRVAREYRRWGLPLEDLIQQGNLGLLRAALKFDPDKACRLITYAAYWIRAEIRDYVVRSYRIVRLGTTRTERRAMRAYRRRGVEDATELAAVSGMPIARAEKLWPLLTHGDVWLDASYDDRSAGMERLPDDADWTPEDDAARHEVVDAVRGALGEALASLSARERRIVEARMMSDEPCTLEQLGREMGVSKERVRQLEARAREKLRVCLADYRPAA